MIHYITLKRDYISKKNNELCWYQTNCNLLIVEESSSTAAIAGAVVGVVAVAVIVGMVVYIKVIKKWDIVYNILQSTSILKNAKNC